jgi:hypothetical protein
VNSWLQRYVARAMCVAMTERRLHVRSAYALATARRLAALHDTTIKDIVERALDDYVEVRAREEVEPGFYTSLLAQFGGTIHQVDEEPRSAITM